MAYFSNFLHGSPSVHTTMFPPQQPTFFDLTALGETSEVIKVFIHELTYRSFFFLNEYAKPQSSFTALHTSHLSVIARPVAGD